MEAHRVRTRSREPLEVLVQDSADRSRVDFGDLEAAQDRQHVLGHGALQGVDVGLRALGCPLFDPGLEALSESDGLGAPDANAFEAKPTFQGIDEVPGFVLPIAAGGTRVDSSSVREAIVVNAAVRMLRQVLDEMDLPILHTTPPAGHLPLL